MIMIMTKLKNSLIDHSTKRNNSRVSKPVLLFKPYSTRFISVI